MQNSIKKSKKPTGLLSSLAAIFGFLTIISGGFALFGGEAGKQFAGDYINFVLWFNFIAGYFYVIAGIGIYLRKKWAVYLSTMLALLTLLTFIGFGVSVISGADYELRTVGAMTVRSIFWIIISKILRK